MRFPQLLFCLCLLFPLKLRAQFSDSIRHNVQFTGTGIINHTDRSNAYLLTNALRLRTRGKRMDANAMASWIYGKQNSQLSNNDFNSTLDFNFRSRLPRFYYWGLGSFEKSYSLKVANRTQGGGGMAYSFLDRGDSVFLNVSNGLLYEYSSLQTGDTAQSFYRTIRNSFRLRMRFRWRQMVTFESTSFIQNSLQNSDDYILRSTNSLSLKLRKWMSFTTAFTYNKVSRTSRENLLFTFGITLDGWF